MHDGTKGENVYYSVYNSQIEEILKQNKDYYLKEGDIVTLSPACASFDMFPNFMIRGNYFKEIVNKMK